MFKFMRVIIFGAVVSLAVSSSPGAQQGPPVRQGREVRTLDPEMERMEREQARARNKQRQEALRKDTERLLQLATQLKDYVGKTNEHVLSLEVLKKAEEIEKLARSVKDKMKAEGAE